MISKKTIATMKGLFKSMMFVAVAAMTFTACQKDNNELNSSKRTIEITANIGNDTRSGFVEKEEGETAYKSQWDGGEMLFVKAENTEKWPVISADGKFSVEFEAGDQFATFYSPVASWEYNSSYGVYMPVVPATQTPRANSVDPAAHILQAQSVYIGGAEPVAIVMQHQVAYGKMTVNTPEDFDIEKVVINLVGDYYGGAKDLTYTINADNVENNVFWFATEPLKVSEFTVSAYNADGEIYAKTVTVEADKLNFDYGRVANFSVSNLSVQEAPALPAFTNAYMYNGDMSDKLVRFESAELGVLQLNFYGCNNDSWIDVGSYGFASIGAIYPGGSYSWYETVDGVRYYATNGTVNVSVVDGKYHFEFVDLVITDYYETFYLNATFTGLIDGLDVPDPRAKLQTPAPYLVSLEGLTATIAWEPVEGAVEYQITCDGNTIETTTETSVELTFNDYRVYYVYVTAVPAESDTQYKASDAQYVVVNIQDPRKYIELENVAYTVEGKTITFTWDPAEGAVLYQIYQYSNPENVIYTTECTATFEMPKYNTSYDFCLIAKAEEFSTEYRDSYAYYIYPKTGYDPNMVIINFTSCELSEYIPGQWRVSYNFSDGNGNSMTLWLTTDHGASDTSLGSTNNYYNYYSSPGSVGNYYRFCPVDVVVNGVSKTVTGGNISVENLGSSWNVVMDIIFDDDSVQVFTYTGGVGTTGDDSGDSGDSGEFTPDYTITSMSFVQLSTSYYSYQWNLSTSNGLSFRIYTPYSQGETLHEGTYTYYSGNGNTNGDFTFSTRLFSPAPGSGSMVVSKDGDTYTINLTLVVGSVTQKYQYVGTL